MLPVVNAAPRTSSWKSLKANVFFCANNIRVLKKTVSEWEEVQSHTRRPARPFTHSKTHGRAAALISDVAQRFPIFVTLKNTLSAGQVHFMSQCEAADVAATEGTHNQHLNSTQPTWVGYIRTTLSPKTFLKQNLCWTSTQLSHPITILHMLQQKQALSTEY